MIENMNKYIDHTLLTADAVEKDIKVLCEEAKEYDFMSVCVNAGWVKQAAELLKDSDVKVCTVVGFPLGATSTEAKVFEAQQAVKDGATEIDMVINIGQLKSGNDDFVGNDIEAVVNATKGEAITKVIIETALLSDEEKVRACELAKEAGADFVKTSTGFSTGGATIEDVKLMRETVGSDVGVKASGGVRDYEGAVEFINAGATRIGASSGIAIVEGSKES
jgi:deoxyribose-phosphate aldolase